jgi:hypothetical protein
VDYFLHGKAFSINHNHNAKAMEKHAKEVSAILGAAKKAKKKITVKIRPVSPTLTLADATRAFMLEGPRKKSKKKVAASDLARDESAFDAFAAFETPESGAEASPATLKS